MNKENFLQKYVDHKLNSVQCDHDDLSDYITNYTDEKHIVDTSILNKWKIDNEYFLEKFKPTENQVRQAVKNSKILPILAEKYKKAAIKGFSTDIIYNIIDSDKEYISYDITNEPKKY